MGTSESTYDDCGDEATSVTQDVTCGGDSTLGLVASMPVLVSLQVEWSDGNP